MLCGIFSELVFLERKVYTSNSVPFSSRFNGEPSTTKTPFATKCLVLGVVQLVVETGRLI